MELRTKRERNDTRVERWPFFRLRAARRKAQSSDESKLPMNRAPGHNLFYRFTRVEMCRQHLLDKQLDVPSRIPFGNAVSGIRKPCLFALQLSPAP